MDFIIVIRSAKERTVECCRKLLEDQVPSDHVEIVEAYPFEEALRRSFKIGIESNKRLLITVDADVLVKPGAIHQLLLKEKKMSEEVFKIEGYLYDGILLKYRKGGVKVYRTKHLQKAIKLIPPNGVEIRPETFTMEKMIEKGCSGKNLYIVTGVHDFEQFRKDIYRKSYIHAIKHPNEIINTLPKWRELAENDSDYRVVIKGIFDALTEKNSIKQIDTRKFSDLSEKALKFLNLEEKKEIVDCISIKEKTNQLLENEEPLFAPMSLYRIKYYYKKSGFLGVLKHAKEKVFNRIGNEFLKHS